MILDDIAFLGQLKQEVLAQDAHLFPVRDAEHYYQNNRDLSNKAARFAGPNPDYGALITYYMREHREAQGSRQGDGPVGDGGSRQAAETAVGSAMARG